MGVCLEFSILQLTGETLFSPIRDYPESTPIYSVCPSCKCEISDGKCPCCLKQVTPVRSAVRNEFFSQWVPVCGYCGKPTSNHFIGCLRPRRAEQRVDWSAA